MSSQSPAALDTLLALDPYLRVRLERLAEAAGRETSELAGAVIRDFLDENERQMAAIDAGIEEADAGQLLDFDDVKTDVLKKLAVLARR